MIKLAGEGTRGSDIMTTLAVEGGMDTAWPTL